MELFDLLDSDFGIELLELSNFWPQILKLEFLKFGNFWGALLKFKCWELFGVEKRVSRSGGGILGSSLIFGCRPSGRLLVFKGRFASLGSARVFGDL